MYHSSVVGAYWEVDLGAVFDVVSVVMWNRREGLQTRMVGASLALYNDAHVQVAAAPLDAGDVQQRLITRYPPTPTNTGTPSSSVTATITASPTGTPSSSATGTPSSSTTASSSQTLSVGAEPSQTATTTASSSSTASPSGTGSVPPTSSVTASTTATMTQSPLSVFPNRLRVSGVSGFGRGKGGLLARVA